MMIYVLVTVKIHNSVTHTIGQVTTGSLRYAKNQTLRKLITKSSNFRNPESLTVARFKKERVTALLSNLLEALD